MLNTEGQISSTAVLCLSEEDHFGERTSLDVQGPPRLPAPDQLEERRAAQTLPGWSYLSHSGYETTSCAGRELWCLRPCQPEEPQPSMAQAPGHCGSSAVTFMSK